MRTAHDTQTAVEPRGQRGIVVLGDVTDEQQVIAMFDQAANELGGLDAVVVNAGIVAMSSYLAEMDGDRIRRMIDVNATGALFSAREAVRRMSFLGRRLSG